MLLDRTGAEAVDECQAPRLVVRVENRDQVLDPLPGHARADLDPDRVRDAAEVLDVGAVCGRRPHADPREMSRQVVPALAAVQESRLRLLVKQVQTFMGRVDVRPARLVYRLPGNRLEEVQGIGDRSHDRVVFVGHRRMAHPVQVPVFRMVQVGESAVDQRSDEVQRQCRALVAAQYEVRVRHPVVRRERAAVDEVAAETGQRLPVACLRVGRPRFGVLPGHASNADYRLFQPVQDYEAHLQQDLELRYDVLGRAFVESLGTVATLQDERFTALRPREFVLERVDFPRGHQRRQPAQLGDGALERSLVRVGRLLRGRQRLPARRVPVGFGNRASHVRVMGAS